MRPLFIHINIEAHVHGHYWWTLFIVGRRKLHLAARTFTFVRLVSIRFHLLTSSCAFARLPIPLLPSVSIFVAHADVTMETLSLFRELKGIFKKDCIFKEWIGEI